MTLTLRIDNFDTLENGGPTSITLDERSASVGRRSSMDWVLPDPSKHISGHHFEIQFSDGVYWLRDLSTNGTYLQGSHHRIDGAIALRGGEQIIVGHYVLSATLAAGAGAAGSDAAVARASEGTWGPGLEEIDPWAIAGEALQPINPLPAPVGDSHQLERLAQEFVPLQQPPEGGFGSVSSSDVPLQPATVIQPPPADKPPIPPVPLPRQGANGPTPLPMPRADPRSSAPLPPPLSPQAPSAAATHDDLIAAFCKGAGVPFEAVADLNPEELMETLGQSTRVTVDEIMRMLQDRASVKQFTRGGERTMRSAQGNNPLKFLPDAEQALVALFLQKRDGFMFGAEGLKTALGDLRTHQSAVFAALQPALAEVLEGLSPDDIDGRETTSGNLLGGSKRGRNWDAFVQRWDEKASASDHGMLDVFLAAFAKAYADAVSGSR